MVNSERERESIASQIENGDQEGTYEQKKDGDMRNKTVFVGSNSNTKVIVQTKTKKKQAETAIFID